MKFHTRVLGMRFIKKIVPYDGSAPICHFYYSNANGDPSSVVTTFPWTQAGLYGKRGTNQAREVLLSVPADSLDYWVQRLGQHDIEATRFEALGRGRVSFHHPSGIEYVLVGNENDPHEGFSGKGVSADAAIHGIHGVGIHVYDQDHMVDFGNEAPRPTRPRSRELFPQPRAHPVIGRVAGPPTCGTKLLQERISQARGRKSGGENGLETAASSTAAFTRSSAYSRSAHEPHVMSPPGL
ncbi:hypothetical protein ACFQH9_13315 [Pseudonocardia lutea]|uniref:Uncharacterized protein n=1 Tax=Pseudonocardia lutea TaxID=2172015 RepID=A0ABW1IAH5_9PSEU